MSFITVAVQCHNFQRRLCWMLSSLAEQARAHILTVSVAYLRGNGQPSTEALVAHFANRIRVTEACWENYSQFEQRGLVRNRQLAECTTEWLLFSDCDMVYHPRYFARLTRELRTKHAGATYMLSAGRMSTETEPTKTLVDSTVFNCPIDVEKAFSRARQLPRVSRRNVGAGFSQLINVRHAPHGGFYVDPDHNRDFRWSTSYQRAGSDIQFRRRICKLGGRRRSLPSWFSRNLIHLNHDRDNEVKRHLEIQR